MTSLDHAGFTAQVKGQDHGTDHIGRAARNGECPRAIRPMDHDMWPMAHDVWAHGANMSCGMSCILRPVSYGSGPRIYVPWLCHSLMGPG